MRLNPLRMVRQLMAEHFEGPVSKPRRGEVGHPVVNLVLRMAPVARDNRLMRTGSRRRESQNRRAVFGPAGRDRESPRRKRQLIELNLDGMKRGEVATQSCVPAGL